MRMDMNSASKYELITDVIRLCDEVERLSMENRALERERDSFKVSDGSGELTPLVRKVYEYGKEVLAKNCFSFSWYNVGVEDVGGVPTPQMKPEDWASDCYKRSYVPDQFSMTEIFEVCSDIIIREHGKKFDEEKEEWLEDHKEAGDDE